MPDNDSHISLTGRERTVLERVARGQTTPRIAADLHLSTETVKWYRKQLLTKFGASTSAEMVRKAVESHLL